MIFEMKSGSKAKFSIACENSLGVGNYSDIIEVSVSDKGLNLITYLFFTYMCLSVCL